MFLIVYSVKRQEMMLWYLFLFIGSLFQLKVFEVRLYFLAP